MNYLKMKARTRDGDWFEFDIADIPTMFNMEEFALFARPGSPLLNKSCILRGDPASGLYEGDIVEIEGDRWLCCYERGFYLINKDYAVKYLNDKEKYNVVGSYFTDKFPISLSLKKKHLFKIKGSIFRFEDIIGATNDRRIFIRGFKSPIEIKYIRQECCLNYDKKRVFFGDKLLNGNVKLVNGRVVCLDTNDEYRDLALRR